MRQILPPSLVWVIASAMLFVCELFVPGFYLFFMGVGGLVVVVITLIFEIPFLLQIAIWIIMSVVMMILLRKRFAGSFSGRKFKSEMEDYLGKSAEVTKTCSTEIEGRIKFRGTTWNAIAQEGKFKKGEMVVLVGRKEGESLAFIVAKPEEKDN